MWTISVFGHDLEQFHRELRRRPGGRGAIAQLARIGLRVGDELRQRRGRHGRMHHEPVRRRADAGNGREVAQRVVGKLRVNGGSDRARSDVALEERIAIGRGACRDGRADGAARSRLVVDHHLLAPEPGSGARRAGGLRCPASRREGMERHSGRAWPGTAWARESAGCHDAAAATAARMHARSLIPCAASAASAGPWVWAGRDASAASRCSSPRRRRCRRANRARCRAER